MKSCDIEDRPVCSRVVWSHPAGRNSPVAQSPDERLTSVARTRSVRVQRRLGPVANASSFTVKKVRFYNSTAMKVPMKIAEFCNGSWTVVFAKS